VFSCCWFNFTTTRVADGEHRLKTRRVAEKVLDKQPTCDGLPIWREGKQVPTIGIQHVTKYYTRPRTRAPENFGFHEGQRIFGVNEQVLASQERFCSILLINWLGKR
jgi:hypothetical protein